MNATEPELLRLSYRCSANNTERDYYLHLPAGYDSAPQKDWPLLFSLHGNGERGNGKDELELLLKNGPIYESWIRNKDLPFIIVAPQLPMFDRASHLGDYSRERPAPRVKGTTPPHANIDRPEIKMERAPVGHSDNPTYTHQSAIEGLPAGWQLCQDDLSKLLDELIAIYRIDTSRLYLSGLSYGGYGTWHWAATEPERWAAIAPICGDADPSHATRFVTPELPIWIFHGGRDRVIFPEWIYEMANALEAAGHQSVRLTIHEELGHNVWDRVYESLDFYQWLLSHRKVKPTT